MNDFDSFLDSCNDEFDAAPTKHASIEAGIGPICTDKWGL